MLKPLSPSRDFKMMELAIWIALGIIVAYVVSGMFGPDTRTIKEGFSALTMPQRSDIGFARDGWEEESGYERDLRYSETFADVQGLGAATDFCRAVQRRGDPDSLRMVCALGRRDGFDTMEYRSRSRGEGFCWSRDDYWRKGIGCDGQPTGRMDYCRIVKDDITGEWYSSCAVAGRNGFAVTEERDTAPPPHIRQLLEAYEDAAVWYRLFDDVEDYTTNTVLEFHGRPEIPTLLKADVSRGLQFNRRASDPPRDYVRWGEPGQLTLSQTVNPRQIRAISFWVWLDTMEGRPRVLDCANMAEGGQVRDRVWIGVEGGDRDLPAAVDTVPERPTIPTPPAPEISNSVGDYSLFRSAQVTELRAAAALALGRPVEPLSPAAALPLTLLRPAPASPDAPKSGTWVFEIWDGEQRIMRLAADHTARAGQWQHVVLTTTDATSWWPTWQMWIDGSVVANRVEGRTIPALSLAENYLGRGMRGCLQDFRIYTKPMTAEKISAAARFMKSRLHASP